MTVQLSHLDKVFFPDDGITKGDLVDYYQEMAPHILGYLRDRPLVLDRYPDGITGQRIVQKNAGKHFPDWVRRTEVGKQGGAVCHVVADRPDTLVYLANQGTIEFHIFLSRVTALDLPDQLVFDLDPPSDDRFDDVRRHALHLRGLLEDELGLTTYVKTTGGKGLHVHVPLRPEEDFDAVRGFARDVAVLLAGALPGRADRGAAEGAARPAALPRHHAQRVRADRGRALHGARPNRRHRGDAAGVGRSRGRWAQPAAVHHPLDRRPAGRVRRPVGHHGQAPPGPCRSSSAPRRSRLRRLGQALIPAGSQLLRLC